MSGMAAATDSEAMQVLWKLEHSLHTQVSGTSGTCARHIRLRLMLGATESSTQRATKSVRYASWHAFSIDRDS